MLVLLVMRLPVAGAAATVLSAIAAAASAAEGVSPWVPIGMSATAAVGLVALFRKVQKDIIGEQDKRYENVQRDLRDARRRALRAEKRAEHSELLHARCAHDNRMLRNALAARRLIPPELADEPEPEPPTPEPTDAELDAELGYESDQP